MPYGRGVGPGLHGPGKGGSSSEVATILERPDKPVGRKVIAQGGGRVVPRAGVVLAVTTPCRVRPVAASQG